MQIEVEKIVFGGWGLGRLNGKAVFVPYVLPGEVVEIELSLTKRDYAFAKLKRIVSPSPDRQEPKCPHFGTCGGCDYQHIPYTLQLEFKQQQIREELRRLPEINIDSLICPIIPSSQPFAYRNRLKLRVKREGYTVKLGTYKKNTRSFTPIKTCPVAEPLIQEMLIPLEEVLTQHAAIAQQLTAIELFSSKDENRGFIVFKTLVEVNKKHLVKMAETIMTVLPSLKDVLYENPAFVYPRSLFDKGYTQSGLIFKIDGNLLLRYPGTFFQVNTDQNRELIKIVTALADITSQDSVLELYAGIGNLSLSLAKKAKRLVGLEMNALAVKNANYNAQRNKARAVFKRLDVETELEEFLKEDNLFELLVVDPPRTGCIRALKTCLGLLQPRKIVYISCHPATLTRDLRFILNQGYKIESIQPLDMFPQTHHLETVAVLTQ